MHYTMFVFSEPACSTGNQLSIPPTRPESQTPLAKEPAVPNVVQGAELAQALVTAVALEGQADIIKALEDINDSIINMTKCLTEILHST